jgi:hypothetical protein
MIAISDKSITAIGQWIADRDTGVSSETMLAIAMGAKKSKVSRFDAPHDPSDFGRCYRLVKAVPEIRTEFGRIGRIVPTFKLILENWDELCPIFERDQSVGTSPDLYRRIKELRGDCQNHPALKAA